MPTSQGPAETERTLREMGSGAIAAEKPSLGSQLNMRKADLQNNLNEVEALISILEKNKELEQALTLFAKIGLRY